MPSAVLPSMSFSAEFNKNHWMCETHWIAGRYEKPWLTAKWARSYHKPDPAAGKLWSFRATPCHKLQATYALTTPLCTCLGAQSNMGYMCGGSLRYLLIEFPGATAVRVWIPQRS